MSIQNQQVEPPSNWQDFERLCFDLYQEIWGDPNALMHGRVGQPQAGVDVYGHDRKGNFTGIQCKGKDGRLRAAVTEKELRSEVEKAKTFWPGLDIFILATSGPADVKIQKLAREITSEHEIIGLFKVYVVSWETLQLLLEKHPDVAQRRLGLVSTATVLQKIDAARLESNQRLDEVVTEVRLARQSTEKLAMMVLPRPGTDNGGNAAEEQLRTRIKDAANLGNSGNARAALAMLSALKESEWPSATPRSKHRILYAIAFVKLSLGLKAEAIDCLRQCAAEDSGEPWSIAALAFAEVLEQSYSHAFDYAKQALAADPTLEHAAIALIHSAPRSVDLSELREMIPVDLREVPQVLLAFVKAADDRSLSDQAVLFAQQAYERAPGDWRCQSTLGSELLRPILDIPRIVLSKVIPRNLDQRFHRGLKLLQSAWEIVSKNDYGPNMPELALNLSGALLVADDEAEAESVLNKAVEVALDPSALHARLSMIYAGRGQIEEALRHLDSVPIAKREEGFDLLRLHLLADLKDYDAVREGAEVLLAELPPGDDRDAAAALALQARIAAGAGTDIILQELDKFPNSIQLSCAALRVRNFDEILKERLNDDAERILGRTDDVRDILLAAEILRAIGKFSRAAEVVAPLVVTNKDTAALRLRLECLINADARSAARDLFEAIDSKLLQEKRYVYYGVQIYEKVGLLEKARNILTQFLKKYPEDLPSRILWCNFCERSAKMAPALAWLKSVPKSVQGRPKDLMTLAVLIDRHLSDPRCFDFGYRALRQGFDDPSIHALYSFQLFLGGRTVKTYKMIQDVVDVGSAVSLVSDEDHGRLVRVIETEPNPRIERNEVGPTDGLAARLMGCRVGDHVAISGPHGDNILYKVDTIQSKFLHSHFDILQKFHERFPESAPFRMVEIKEHPGPDQFEKIFQLARVRSERLSSIEVEYATGRVPLALFAQACGCSIFDVWDDLRLRRHPSIISAGGTEPERRDAIRLLDNATLCVFDAFTCYVISTLEIATDIKMSIHGKRLATTQAALDHLLDEANRRRADTDGGRRGSLVWSDSGPSIVEITGEALELRASWAERALEFARTCEVIAAASEHPIHSEAASIYQVLQADALDSVLACRGSDGILIAEDMPLRNLAEAAADAKGVWLQAVLRYGLHSGRIPVERYCISIERLVGAGHRYTSIGAMEILYALRAQMWLPTGTVPRYLELLAMPTNDRASVDRVIAELLENLWLSTRGDYRFGLFLSHLLDTFFVRQEGDIRTVSTWLNELQRWADRQFSVVRRPMLMSSSAFGLTDLRKLHSARMVASISAQIQNYLKRHYAKKVESSL